MVSRSSKSLAKFLQKHDNRSLKLNSYPRSTEGTIVLGKVFQFRVIHLETLLGWLGVSHMQSSKLNSFIVSHFLG